VVFLGVQFCFEIRSAQKSLVLSCKSEKEYREWKYAIFTNLQAVLNKRRLFIEELEKKRSATPDSKQGAELADQYRRISTFIGNSDLKSSDGKAALPKCKLCLVPFAGHFFKKKVKCFLCQDEVCGKCSEHLTKDAKKKDQPICDACHGLQTGFLGDSQSAIGAVEKKEDKKKSLFGF
jgi:hypothetical protein